MNAQNADDGLHFTATASMTSPELTLNHAVQMVKVGLLYADQVTLYSIDAGFYLAVKAMKSVNLAENIELYEQLLLLKTDGFEAQSLISEGLRQYKALKRANRLSNDERRWAEAIEEVIRTGPVQQGIDELLEQPGRSEFDAAMHSGFVDMRRFQNQVTWMNIFDDDKRNEIADGMVQEYITSTLEAVIDGSTYPLLDRHAVEVLNERIKQGDYSPSEGDMRRGRHAGLTGHIMERLPLFSDATVAEVLDVRSELDKPLRRFRASVVRFSDEISATAWDKDFRTEADALFMRDVEPAVFDIEEAIRANNPLRSLANRGFSKAGLVTAGGSATLGGLITKMTDLPNVLSSSALTLAGLSAAAIGATKVVSETYDSWRSKRREIEGNQFYFVYEAGRRLERGQRINSSL